MTRHSVFIMTPIAEILDEAGMAIANLTLGIENFPLKEYFLQSIFLKLTGAQEQKCKCILWDVATYDYELRYQKFGGRGEGRGECSTLKEKDDIYKSLLSLLNTGANAVSVNGLCDDTKRASLLITASDHVGRFYRSCARQGWPKKEYDDYEHLYSKIKRSDIYQDKSILKGPMGDKGTLAHCYDLSVFKHRNRCAHNLLSYQGNKPNFNQLRDEFVYWNYYFRFALILLVDSVLTDVYEQWTKLIDDGKYDD